MATIATSQYLDNWTGRTAGEAWTINSWAELTIRTDSRVHANAPASMTGSFGSMTINKWKIIIDARNIRWMAYNSGTGNVPAIGTNITQWWVSWYLLWVWASITSAPTTAWSAMPASGFIKFREVTGWTFASWALTGIWASSTGPDVQWWMEIVWDEAMNVTVPRLWEFRTRWGFFDLGTTSWSIWQVIQLPTNGGWANTFVAWVSIETSPGSWVYEDYPGLGSTLTNGWARQHLWTPVNGGDSRQKFVKSLWSWQVQIWESVSLSATYASIAAQAGTYATIAHAMTYTWINNVVECYIVWWHGLRTGQQTGLDFTSWWATANDGIYTVTVLDGFRFTVPLTGSGASWNVTSRPGILVTFTAHGLNVWESTYCDFTTGTGADGTYEVYGVPTANTYQIKHPHTVALTSGDVSCIHTLQVTFTAHALAVWNRVTLDFTTGTGVDGNYTLKAVAANTFNVNIAHSATTSGNVTINMTIGYVPASGCKIRVPNIFFRNCTTAARATNVVPNTTLGTRPEFVTTSAGAIDIECWNFDWYCNFGQPYSIRIYNSFMQDTLAISECATALDIDWVTTGMYWNINTPALNLISNFAAGTISNIKAQRWSTPATSAHSVFMQSCIGQILNNIQWWIIQFARSTWYAFQISNSQNITLNNSRWINSQCIFTSSFDCTVNDYDDTNRYIWYTNATANNAISVNGSSKNIIVDGINIWFWWTIPNVAPYTWLVNVSASSIVKIRNVWSLASPINTNNWAPNLTGMWSVYVTSGNNYDVRFQRVYVSELRNSPLSLSNSDKKMLFESVQWNYYSGTNAIQLLTYADIEWIYKWVTGSPVASWGTSVYGSHFNDAFNGTSYWMFQLHFNEPTSETISQYTAVSWTILFDSLWGINMPVIGNQVIWEDSIFRKWHTGFANITPSMNGGTIGNYTLEYQINLWSWYSAWKTLNKTNLTAEVVDPAIGYRMKIRITTSTTNTSSVKSITIFTTTSVAAQWNLYPLDTVTLSLTGLVSWSDIVILEAWTTNVLESVDSNSGTLYNYIYSNTWNVDIWILKSGYIPLYIRNYTLWLTNSSIPISQIADRNYL